MRTCAVCQNPFEPRFNSLQAVCGIVCSGKVGKLKRKAERVAVVEAKARLKTLPDLRQEAQKAFNEFIRARDSGKPCVCCGKYPQGNEAITGGAWDAGHYRSRGANPELAFDERNCHAQLKRCNRYTWDVAGYRAELIRRIGLAEVESLEGHHEPKKYTRADMIEIRDTYKAKLKAMKKETA